MSNLSAELREAPAAVFSNPAWSQDLRLPLSGAPRAVKVLSPCCGLNAPERAARELLFPWESVGDWDFNIALLRTLEKLTANHNSLHIGAIAGNILSVDVHSLDLGTDGIVSGPPCPPFSSLGKRLCELDARSSVFVAVCHWILYLARHGRVSFYILENVKGILSKRKRSGCSFADWFTSEMQTSMPEWHISVVQHNSRQCLTAQSRPRVFFVGTAPCLRSSRRLQRLVEQPPMSWPPLDPYSLAAKLGLCPAPK